MCVSCRSVDSCHCEARSSPDNKLDLWTGLLPPRSARGRLVPPRNDSNGYRGRHCEARSSPDEKKLAVHNGIITTFVSSIVFGLWPVAFGSFTHECHCRRSPAISLMSFAASGQLQDEKVLFHHFEHLCNISNIYEKTISPLIITCLRGLHKATA